MEEWRPVPRFRRIEVSNLGNVRTVWAHKVKNLQPMKMKTTVGHYLKVSVTDAETGKQRQIGIHNLVAEAFLPIPEEKVGLKLEPNHDDGDKLNNRASNLEWVTRAENLAHALRTGLRKPSSENGKALYIDKSKAVKAVDVSTGEVHHFSSAKELSEKLGIPQRTAQRHAFKDGGSQVRGYVLSTDN